MLKNLNELGGETGWEYTAYIYPTKDEEDCPAFAYTDPTTDEEPSAVTAQVPTPDKPALEHGHNHPNSPGFPGSGDRDAAEALDTPVTAVDTGGENWTYYPEKGNGTDGHYERNENVYDSE